MKFTKLVPNIFYRDIKSGLKTFVDCLGFTIGYSELNSQRPFCVVEKDGLKVHLFQDKKYADEHNPEFRDRDRQHRGSLSAGEIPAPRVASSQSEHDNIETVGREGVRLKG